MITQSYLSPEPLLQNPRWVKSQLQSGYQVPTYSYGANNPISNTDLDGNRVQVQALRFYWDLVRAMDDLDMCPCAHQFFRECYGEDPFSDQAKHMLLYDPDDSLNEALCGLKDGLARTVGLNTYFCSQHFSSTNNNYFGDDKNIKATIMHELAHQMGGMKTDHVISCGRVPSCSADDADGLGYAIGKKGCERACREWRTEF